jgi:hypothetical protein
VDDGGVAAGISGRGNGGSKAMGMGKAAVAAAV